MAKVYQIKVTDSVAEKLEKIAKEEGLTVQELFIKAIKDLKRNKELKQKLIKMIEDL